MRRPRLPITLRQLTVAVGIIALALAMRRQSAAYHQRAEAYAWIAFHHGSGVWDENGQLVDRDPATRVRDAWAQKMAEKYWRLSDDPWLPVEPDPPPPPEALSHLTATLEPPTVDAPNWEFRLTNPPAWTLLWTWQSSLPRR
jgi:hypothetical protein